MDILGISFNGSTPWEGYLGSSRQNIDVSGVTDSYESVDAVLNRGMVAIFNIPLFAGTVFAFTKTGRIKSTVESTDLLGRNRALLTKMKELAVRQEKLISGDQIHEFLELSDQRERLKVEITRNTGQYSAMVKNSRDRGMKRKNSALSGEIADVIRSIQEVDQRIERLIIEKRDSILNQAEKLKKGKKALRGYGGKVSRSPRFINRKG